MGLKKKVMRKLRKRVYEKRAEKSAEQFQEYHDFKAEGDYDLYKEQTVPKMYRLYRKLPINRKKVFFESLSGRTFSDNPKAIYDELYKRKLGYKLVWAFSWAGRKAKIGERGIAVPYESKWYYYHLATSKYIVSNINQFQLEKRKGQVVINTMHGTPLKYMGFDTVSTYQTYEKMKVVFNHDWDYVVSRCDFMTDVLRGPSYEYKGPILKVGYPRNDSLFTLKDNEQFKAKTRAKLHIPEGKKVILWAPTWRTKKRFDMKLDLDKMKEAFGDEYVLVIRAHPFEAKYIDKSVYSDFVINGKPVKDANAIMAITDVLVTDYSSIMFDFTITKRPIVLFTWDYDRYVRESRGTYFDLKEEYPELVAMTTEEVIGKIKNPAELAECLEEFNWRFGQYETGHAAKDVVDFFWGKGLPNKDDVVDVVLPAADCEGKEESKTKTIIMVTNSFSATSGGRTGSMFNRANLYQSMGYKVCIAMRNSRPWCMRAFEELCRKYDVQDVELLTPYMFFAEGNIFADCDCDPSGLAMREEITEPDERGVRQKITLDASGRVYRRQWIEEQEEAEKVLRQHFIDPADGRVFLEFDHCHEGGVLRTWYKKNGEIETFKGDNHLAYWYARMAQQYKNVVFVSEEHRTDSLLLNNRFAEHPLKVICIIHSTFFAWPNTYGSEVNDYLGRVFSAIDKYAAIITLTPQEKSHIANYYGDRDHLFCIPHPQKAVQASGSRKKGMHSIVICSRLEPLKRIDHVVRAMPAVLQSIPDATLDIYGSGSQAEELENLVKELGLSDFVKLRGYTDKPIETVDAAGLTVVSSRFEGLSLAIYEALMCGTPVVSYDFLYGPRFFIEDGKNGVIVPNGDIEALAKGIVSVLGDEERHLRMIEAARNMDNRFAAENIRASWEKVFASIDSSRYNLRKRLDRSVRIEEAKLFDAGKVEKNGRMEWCLIAEVKARRGMSEPRYILSYAAANCIDYSDELFVHGAILESDEDKAIVGFKISYEKKAFDVLFAPDVDFALQVVAGSSVAERAIPRQSIEACPSDDQIWRRRIEKARKIASA